MPTQVVFNDNRKYRPVHLAEDPTNTPAPEGGEESVPVQTPNGKTTDVATPDPKDQPGAETTWAIPMNYIYIGGGVLGLLLLMKMLKK